MVLVLPRSPPLPRKKRRARINRRKRIKRPKRIKRLSPKRPCKPDMVHSNHIDIII
jgi:hypothetical protein